MTLSVATKHSPLRKRLSVQILADFDGSRENAGEFKATLDEEIGALIGRLAAKHDLHHLGTETFSVECEG